MQIAYLVNRYPTVSHTFVRREILGVEAAGHRVHRFSIRGVAGDLPDPADVAERDLTTVVLDQSLTALIGAALAVTASRPTAVIAAWRRTRPMTPRTPRGWIARLAYLVEACWLARRCRRDGVQHLHAHFGTNPAAVARLVHRLTGIPYSFTVHGPDEFDEPRQLDLGGKIEESRFVVAISHYGRSQLCRWVAPAQWPKIAVVRCGVDLATLGPDRRPLEPTIDFCCIARLAPQKGLPILIEAVARLRDRGITTTVAIVGDGDLRPSLTEQIARLGLGDSITLLGSRSGDEVAATLRSAKAMVLPSFAEGLPVVLMEALAVGTPVVTTGVAGIPELVDEGCGWIIPPASSDALATAMAAVLATDAATLAALGAEGRRRVERDHDAGLNAAALASHIATVAP